MLRATPLQKIAYEHRSPDDWRYNLGSRGRIQSDPRWSGYGLSGSCSHNRWSLPRWSICRCQSAPSPESTLLWAWRLSSGSEEAPAPQLWEPYWEFFERQPRSRTSVGRDWREIGPTQLFHSQNRHLRWIQNALSWWEGWSRKEVLSAPLVPISFLRWHVLTPHWSWSLAAGLRRDVNPRHPAQPSSETTYLSLASGLSAIE